MIYVLIVTAVIISIDRLFAYFDMKRLEEFTDKWNKNFCQYMKRTDNLTKDVLDLQRQFYSLAEQVGENFRWAQNETSKLLGAVGDNNKRMNERMQEIVQNFNWVQGELDGIESGHNFIIQLDKRLEKLESKPLKGHKRSRKSSK